MRVRGPRLTKAGAVIVALLVLAGDVAAGVLLARAVPYLDVVDVAAEPTVGVLYAAGAVMVAFTPRRQGFVALLVIAVALAAPAASVGLAQTSWLWVPV